MKVDPRAVKVIAELTKENAERITELERELERLRPSHQCITTEIAHIECRQSVPFRYYEHVDNEGTIMAAIGVMCPVCRKRLIVHTIPPEKSGFGVL